MAKRKTARASKPKGSAPAKRKKWSASRGRSIKSNGSAEQPIPVAPDIVETVTIGEAMRLAVEKLGDVTIDKDLAPQQLRELGELFEDVTRRQAAYDAKSEEAKTAKKSLEGATEMLLERVRAFTHPTPMPLFDAVQEEDSRAEMLAGGDVEELGVKNAPAVQ